MSVTLVAQQASCVDRVLSDEPLKTSAGDVAVMVPCECWNLLTEDFRRLVLRDALLVTPSPFVADAPLSEAHAVPQTRVDVINSNGLGLALAVATARWLDVMEPLVVSAEPTAAARRVEDMQAWKWRWAAEGHTAPFDTLAELIPELAELLHDGSAALLGLPALHQAYSTFATAFATQCSHPVKLPAPTTGGASAQALEACRALCSDREQACARAFRAVEELHEDGFATVALGVSNEAIALDPTRPEPFLARARANLAQGARWRCAEDVRLYLWWSSRRGFRPGCHSSAYRLLAESFTAEVEERSGNALADKFPCRGLTEQAEASLRLACRFDRSGQLARSSATRLLGNRIQAHRATSLSAEDLDSLPPIVPDASPGAGSATPQVQAYALPWPLDLSAGLPDTALFSRMPAVGSANEHEPLELLFLDSRSVLDVLATLQGLAERAAAYAQRNPEVLHWKYRPKPVQIHLRAPAPERLAHTLLCLALVKQVGSGIATEALTGTSDADAARRSFSMEETCQDRFLCSLLAAVLFCRTLAAPQRAEVDRVLSLLVLASAHPVSMRSLFPWLELDSGQPPSALATDPAGLGSGGAHLVSIAGREEWASSPLLFCLQQVWLGWLATGAGEVPGAANAGTARVDQDGVHRTAHVALLGARAATLCASLGSAEPSPGTGLSQRHIWALMGHLPAGELQPLPSPPTVSGDGDEETPDLVYMAQVQACIASRMQPPDPRLRWRPLLREISDKQRDGRWRGTWWRLNPCVLDPVDWTYDASAVVDPFQAFSWKLRGGLSSEAAAEGAEAWSTSLRRLTEQAEPSLPAPGSAEPPAIEVLWEHLMGQLKSLSAVLNSPEAASSANQRMPTTAAQPHPQSPARPAAGLAAPAPLRAVLKPAGAAGGQSAGSSSGLGGARASANSPRKGHTPNALGGVRVSTGPQMAEQQRLEEARLAKEDTKPVEVAEELEKFRRWRQDRSLDLEINDYVKLAAVRRIRGDWWGEGAACTKAYKESIDLGEEATWDPAPGACVPLRLHVHASAGSVWRAADAAAARRMRFDAVDAGSLLCTEVGLLGLCTELEPLLKPTAHAYVQTRQCEEIFLDHARAVHDAIATDPAGYPASVATPLSARAAPVLGPAPRQTAAQLAAPGQLAPVLRPPKQRVVLTKGGLVRRVAPAAAAGSNSAVQSARGAGTRRRSFSAALEPLPPDPLLPTAKPSRDREPAALPAPQPVSPAVSRMPPPPQDGVAARLLPAASTRPPVGGALRVARDPARQPAPAPPAPPYEAESALFTRLAQESLSARAGAADWQYLLGVAARAEPISGELCLSYLGASALPMRHDFLFWDSSLEAGASGASNWPSAAGHPSTLLGALGGAQVVPPRERGATDKGPKNGDRLATVGRHWPSPGARERALALGPRLIRFRRLGGHPSLCLRPAAGEGWQCSNAAFCSRAAAPDGKVSGGGFEGTAVGELVCQRCWCARYCSKACQAAHRHAHEFECEALRSLRRASRKLEARGAQENRKALVELLREMLLKQLSMAGSAEALSSHTQVGTRLRQAFPGSGAITSPALEAVKWSRVVLPSSSHTAWSVDLDPLFGLQQPDAADPVAAVLEAVPKMLFDVQLSRAHSAAGVVRLMARWLTSGSRTPALRAAADSGLVFEVVSGISQCGRHGGSGSVPGGAAPGSASREDAALALATHQMALHVAALQEWRALTQSFEPPPELEAKLGPGATLENAPWGAFCATFRPLRLSFQELRPLRPVICVAWGDAARLAVQAVPGRSRVAQSASPTAKGDTPSLRTFVDAAAGHMESIQLIDNVQLDVVTGTALFLAQTSLVEGRGGADSNSGKAYIMLLDASRGMQVVSSPALTQSLQRCSL